jgi:hypothetical protein
MTEAVLVALVLAAGFIVGCYLLAIGCEHFGAQSARIRASALRRPVPEDE